MTNIPDDIIAKLFLLEHPSVHVPEMFKQIYGTIAAHAKTTDVPWGMVLPERLAEKFNKDLEIFNDMIRNLRNTSPYLLDVFIPTEEYLFKPGSLFQPAKIDPVLFEQYSHEDTTKIVSGFEPDSDGFALVPRYSRASSATGRLVVEHGPNILNLKKQHRNMIVSRWGAHGAIIGLDYQALEPSMLVCLNKSSLFSHPHVSPTLSEQEREKKSMGYTSRILREGIYSNSTDPYIEILARTGLVQDDASIPELRDVMKSITVSRMNGMQTSGLIAKINETFQLTHGITAAKLVEIVDDVLCLDDIQKKLYSEWTGKNSCSFVENYYGRPILCDSDNLLINRYFQSSAVDLAMSGFKNVVSYIQDDIPDTEEFLTNIAVPLYLLHDMIVFDVNTGPGSSGLTTINSLAKIGSRDLPGFEDGSFKLRQTPFIHIPKQ